MKKTNTVKKEATKKFKPLNFKEERKFKKNTNLDVNLDKNR